MIDFVFLFNSMSEGFCLIEMLYDEQGRANDYRYLEVNPAFTNQSGLQNVVGKRIREFAPNLEEFWFENFAKVASTGQSVEIENQAKDLNRWFNVKVFKVNAHDSKQVGLLFTDITARKHMEEKVNLQIKRLLETERLSKVGSWQWDLITNEFTFSDQWKKIHGVTKGKLSMDELIPIAHIDDANAINAAFQDCLDGVKEKYDINHRIIRQDNGDIRYIRAVAEVAGPEHSGTPTMMVGFVQDITDQVNAKKSIEKSLKEKETLLKEIHHRVKNNLQVVSSMLSLQKSQETDQHTVEILRESERRIKVMSQLHETLHKSNDLSSISISEYLNAVASASIGLFEGQQPELTCTCDVEKIRLTISQAMALGQIPSELLSNCAKHAFVDRQAGNVKVALHYNKDKEIELSIVDDGVGFPNDFNIDETSTLGLRLTLGLVQQLHGKLSIDSSQGASIKIIFQEKPL